MNKIIARVAFIEACKNCKAHAHIRYPDGSVSEEFVSRAQGHKIILQSTECGVMAEDNAQELHRQIDEFKFPQDMFPAELNLLMTKILEHAEEIATMILQEIDEMYNFMQGSGNTLPGESPLKDDDDEEEKGPKLN